MFRSVKMVVEVLTDIITSDKPINVKTCKKVLKAALIASLDE